MNNSNCTVICYHVYEKNRTDQHDNSLDVSSTRTIRRHQLAGVVRGGKVSDTAHATRRYAESSDTIILKSFVLCRHKIL